MKKVAILLFIFQFVLSLSALPSPTQSAPASMKDFDKNLKVALEATQEIGLAENAKEIKRVNDIGYRVAQRAAPEMTNISFRIVKMEEPNAFALPGGFIFVTTGMMDLDLNDDELAALLGHEITHVHNDHFHRMAKRQTLMNLLYQALIVGIAVGIKDNNSGYDPNTNIYTPSSKSQILEGVTGFGLIFQELLLRGFSRDLELEADEGGIRAATGAGFSPHGASELFEKMRKKIYEAPGYGYWRTHPYLEDRVAALRVLSATLESSKNPPDPEEYRKETQENFLNLLPQEKDEKTQVELRRMALNALPHGTKAQDLRLWFVHDAEAKEMKKEKFFRDYGKLSDTYEANMKEIVEDDPKSPLLSKLKEDQEKIKKEREEVLPLYEQVLTKQSYDTEMLERFLSNFPDNPHVAEVEYRLAENYRLLNKVQQAVDLHLKILAAGELPWKERAKERLLQLIPRLEDLSATYRLVSTKDESISKPAAERMKELSASFKTLQNGYEFRRKYPRTEFDKPVVTQMSQLAENALHQGKLYQAVGEYQKALDQYGLILRYGSDLPVADQVRDTIVDIQELSSVKNKT
jgi:predicted Zn-dependent protease